MKQWFFNEIKSFSLRNLWLDPKESHDFPSLQVEMFTGMFCYVTQNPTSVNYQFCYSRN
jgi:hypothetical protein